MCYNSCTHFVAHAGVCRLPRGYPCPMDYADDADDASFQRAQDQADWLSEQSRFFTHTALSLEGFNANSNYPGIVPA